MNFKIFIDGEPVYYEETTVNGVPGINISARDISHLIVHAVMDWQARREIRQHHPSGAPITLLEPWPEQAENPHFLGGYFLIFTGAPGEEYALCQNVHGNLYRFPTLTDVEKFVGDISRWNGHIPRDNKGQIPEKGQRLVREDYWLLPTDITDMHRVDGEGWSRRKL